MKTIVSLTRRLVFAIALAGAAIRAEVKLPAIIGSHMVLQRDMSLPISIRRTPLE